MSNRILHPRVAIISDLHVGSPENARLEDFDRDADFERLLREVIPAQAGGQPATLVINGDFIDFPQILPELGKGCPADRVGVTEQESLQRVAKAIAGHPRVFAALREFLAAGNQVIYLCGNHDVDCCHESVQGALRTAMGAPRAPAYQFVADGTLQEQRIYVEHGNQYSYDNWFAHWGAPILDGPGRARRIERPWGTMFMDLVYNDIEDLYPFVNKVRPQMALARIILRLVRKDPKVSTAAIAKLLQFFVLHGKRMVWEHLLGTEQDAGFPFEGGAPAAGVVSRDEIVAAARELCAGMSEERVTAVIDEVAVSLRATASAPSTAPATAGSTEGLLGRTEERGIARRVRDLLESGTVDVIAFGHTHGPQDQTEARSGRTCRVLNTGGWIPRIIVPDGATPTLAELEAAPRVHDLRYAWIDLGAGAPTATLHELR